MNMQSSGLKAETKKDVEIQKTTIFILASLCDTDMHRKVAKYKFCM